MVVQHNMQAMNANRMLGITTGSQSKATEKLSSGYRINRAADDAAGLTISEKMRKQMRGLDRASTNAQDGVSCVQTAEGALTEVHSMLQRMNELAVQSANGTNATVDREAIQAEINQLSTEIDRVSSTTKFNETYLLKGDAANGTKDVYTYSLVTTPEHIEYSNNKAATDFYEPGKTTKYADEDALLADLKAGKKPCSDAAAVTTQDAGDKATEGAGNDYEVKDAAATADFALTATPTLDNTTTVACTYTWDDGNSKWVYKDAEGNADTTKDVSGKGNLSNALTGIAYDNSAVNDGVTVTVTAASVTKTGELYAEDGTTPLTDAAIIAADKAGDQLYKVAAAVSQTESTDATYVEAKTEPAKLYDKDGKAVAASDIGEMVKKGEKLYEDAAHTKEATDLTKFTKKATVNEALELNLHVGADSSDDNKISVKIESMSAAGIGVNDLDVSSEDAATAAIDTIASAIQQVSEQRSALGAIQNRLEHTIANLDNVVENTTAAESRIRDTDMAEMMVEYSKNNILAQAGQSMLAQANQSTQGVLSLLG